MWVSLMIMIKLLIMVVAVLMGVAFVSFKGMQLSVEPQMVGEWGVLQPFADVFNLLAKESILPNHANTIIFLLAPIISLVLMMFETGAVLADMNMEMLYLFAVSFLGAYVVLCWASNSSYDLVSEFHTEYSAVLFFLFFLNEYGHVILMSYFNVLLFSGGWLSIINLAPFTWIPKVVSLGIKIPKVPFHIWLPQAYVEAPITESVFLAGVLFKLGAYGFIHLSLPLFVKVSILFYVRSLVSMMVGVIAALNQSYIKRLLAYSAMAHVEASVVLSSLSLHGVNLLRSLLLHSINLLHGLSLHGSTFLSMFMPQGALMALAPLLVSIELVSYSASTISLGARLAANISAGHLLLAILSGFTWTMLAAGYLLSLAVAVIQVYAFTLLTCISINVTFKYSSSTIFTKLGVIGLKIFFR